MGEGQDKNENMNMNVVSHAIPKTSRSFVRRLSRSSKTITQWWIIKYFEIKYFFLSVQLIHLHYLKINPWYHMLTKLINIYQHCFPPHKQHHQSYEKNKINKGLSGASKHKVTCFLVLNWISWFGSKWWLLLCTKHNMMVGISLSSLFSIFC